MVTKAIAQDSFEDTQSLLRHMTDVSERSLAGQGHARRVQDSLANLELLKIVDEICEAKVNR